jgi:hypothetical protein
VLLRTWYPVDDGVVFIDIPVSSVKSKDAFLDSPVNIKVARSSKTVTLNPVTKGSASKNINIDEVKLYLNNDVCLWL